MVPVSDSPTDTSDQFLDGFYSSTINGGSGPHKLKLYETFTDCFRGLDDKSKADLALCDVAWWVRFCLSGTSDPTQNYKFGSRFIGGLYCGIHVHMVSTHESVIYSIVKN